MIVKPVSQEVALRMIHEEWNRIACLASLVIPPASIYARCVNRWIIPLAEPPHEGPDGVMRKSENRQVRLDMGFLMSQRRKFALKAREKAAAVERSKTAVDSYYKVERRKHPGRRLSDHRRLIPFGTASAGKMRSSAGAGTARSSLAVSNKVRSGPIQGPGTTTSKVESTPKMDGARGLSIASKRGTFRNSQRPGSNLMVGVKKPKFNLDRLLTANKNKPPHEKIYWLYPMRAGRQRPPKTFAKLVKINQTDDEKAILDMRTEFLNMYYPVANREKFREAELDQSLLYPQYDQNIIRGMVHDEIFWTYSQAQEAIRNSKEDMKETRQPFEEQKRKLKDAIADMDMKLRPNGSETRISTGLEDPADALKSANAADRREYLRILDHKSVLPESDEEDEVEEILPNGFPSRALKRNQLVGNNELNVVKNWAVLSKFTLAEEQAAKAKHAGGTSSSTGDKGGATLGVPGREGKSHLSIPVFGPRGTTSGEDTFSSKSVTFQEQDASPPTLTIRQLLLNQEEDPSDADCIFMKLCVDSGHSNFYFDIGGDSEDEEDEKPLAMPPGVDGHEEEDKTRRRRQSSLVAEGMSKSQFGYLDRDELFKSLKSFRHMNGNLSEKDRNFFIDQEKERKREIERQKELARQQELERRRLEELERLRLIELEKQRLAGVDRQRLAELGRQRLAELEWKRLEELERQRLAELERQRLEKLQLEELERQRLAELERKRLAELERQRLEKLRLEELERQRLAELERKRLEELERQRLERIRLEEIERKRLEAERLEKLRQEELERQRLAQLERQRLAEEERQRLEKIRREELERQRLAELERQRLEKIRLAEEEKKRLEAARLERLRLAEEERKRVEAERLRREEEERRRKEEEERKRQEELERQRLAEAERQRLAEIERQRLAEIERLRQEEIERQRQAELERKRLEELERRRMLDAERTRLEEIERQRLAELERIRLEEEEAKRKEEEEKRSLAEIERAKKEEADKKRQLEIARQAALERQRAALRDAKKKKIAKYQAEEEEVVPEIPEDQPADDSGGQPFRARLFKPHSAVELAAEDEEDVGEALLDKINEKLHKDLM
ncbi:hypothetical protein RvY_08060-1 [Ramazzottius varieornatus]|uniref:Uncharacterized protein n=2 Tax=Ramazzottius varieornatus TaxID=947166 RepID=A0A1D1V6W4_RAMVA|nr:hypothetical protein RvY_08060-1 [Ramazzottius varieornatus]